MMSDPNEAPAQAPYPPAQPPARRGRFAVFGVVVALGLVALVVASAALVMGVGRGHSGPASTIVFQLQAVPGSNPVGESALTTTASILKARLDAEGIDAGVETQLPDQVVVHVYGAADLTSIATDIGATGRIEFILMPKETYGTNGTPGSQELPADGSPIDASLPAQFTGNDLDQNATSAAPDINSQGRWKINFAFNAAKADQFATWTGQHINEFFAISLDRRALSIPYIMSQITGGAGEISGQFTEPEAKHLAAVLKFGALPYRLQVVSISGPDTASPR